MNEKIDKLIEVLNLKFNKDGYCITSWGKKTRAGLRATIREVLGIDKQCFQCLEYFFDGDLSKVEETGQLVCESCAEGIISGSIKIKE